MSKVLVAIVHGDEAHTLEMPFCPNSGMVLMFTPLPGKAQRRFKVSKVRYDCDVGEVSVEGEFLPDSLEVGEETFSISGLSPRQGSLLVDLARVGLTQGFYDIREWVSVYGRYCDLLGASPIPDKAYEEMLKSVASLFSLTAPDYYPSTKDVIRIVNSYLESCCYPGCEKKGEFSPEGMENTNLKLCENHKGCVRRP